MADDRPSCAVFSIVASGLLGRTNQQFPSIWLSLRHPSSGVSFGDLASAAVEARAPIDVSNKPALWGGMMRGTDATLMVQSSLDYQRATDEDHACDLIQAHLIEVLSCIGREWMDLYYLRVETMPEEFQLSGALQALELAKQEGHVKHIGLSCAGIPFAALGAWQFHDAFETLLVPRSYSDGDAYQVLSPLARERRVGIVTSQPFRSGNTNWLYDASADATVTLEDRDRLMLDVLAGLSSEHPVLVDVDSPRRIELAIQAASQAIQPDTTQRVADFVARFQLEPVGTGKL